MWALLFPIRIILASIKIMIVLVRIPIYLVYNTKRYRVKTEVDNMSSQQFKLLIEKVLEKNGYTDITLSNDYGIDIIARKDDITYGFLCKHHKTNVDIPILYQAIDGCKQLNLDVPVVVTNHYFTNQAIRLARGLKVTLIDFNTLTRMRKKQVKTKQEANTDS